ncbi:hypothetical protein [[Bacillus] enclensis]|uniref:hypothetical protein n=1 Tax=[Bacillus] enclensis TaxID=1402860 RepID=UPI0012E384B0|nr:hypothetical protein [[Bacillus] enclensis]
MRAYVEPTGILAGDSVQVQGPETLEGNDRDFYVGYMEVIDVLDTGDEMAALA